MGKEGDISVRLLDLDIELEGVTQGLTDVEEELKTLKDRLDALSSSTSYDIKRIYGTVVPLQDWKVQLGIEETLDAEYRAKWLNLLKWVLLGGLLTGTFFLGRMSL
jgi:hypothetical protein